MRTTGIIMLILCGGLLLPSTLVAATIELKSGEVFKAKILRETDSYIELRRRGPSLLYPIEEIASIEREPGDAQREKAPVTTSALIADALSSLE